MDITELVKLLSAKDEQINQLLQQVGNLQAQLENLLRILYGKKSEKKPPVAKASNNDETNVDSNAQSNKPKNKPFRKKLPEDLPRENIRYELTDSELTCTLCHSTCKKIGEEVSEQLEIVPAKLFVKKLIRYKYGCKNGCCVKIAPMPIQPIPKGIPGPGLLAEVAINKYQDSLPLYRQAQRFNRHGIDIPESTLCDWVSQTAQLLSPLVKLMHQDQLRESKLHTDDTPVPVLASGKTKKGRLWVYVSDQNNAHPCTVYDYSATREQAVPQKYLKGYKGYLQADAFPGYDILFKSGEVIEVGCMAHVRRKFFEIAEIAGPNTLADEAINLIGKIYAIEDKCRHIGHKKRYYYRKKYLRPVYRKLQRWLVLKQKRVIPNIPLYKAISYALNHWRALQNVFADGRLEVDNNLAERAMRIVAIGRKNWLFAGNDKGGHNAAIYYSLLESAKQNGLNTFEYLSDIIAKIPNTSIGELSKLLPYHYSK